MNKYKKSQRCYLHALGILDFKKNNFYCSYMVAIAKFVSG